MKEEAFEEAGQEEKLLQTIKFPKNLKNLNENLPKAKYDEDSAGHRFKTAKVLKTYNENKEASRKLLPTPSLKLITSEKCLAPQKSVKDLLARKPKVLNKNGSQKLIF